MNSFQLAFALFAEPRVALRELDREPRFLFPLLLMTLGSAFVVTLYFIRVDMGWFSDLMLSSDARLRNAKTDGLHIASRNVMLTSSLVAVLVGIPLVRVVESAYYFLVGRVVNMAPTYRHWISLACWGSLPLAIPLVVMVIVLFLHPNGQVSQEQLNLLSINELFLGIPRSSRWHTIATTLTVLHPWAWWLVAFGVRVWTGRSWLLIYTFSVLPWIVFYGGWALFTAV